MCVENCRYERLGKATRFWKVFSLSSIGELRSIGTKHYIVNKEGRLVRGKPGRERFHDRRSFQVFLSQSDAKQFRDAMSYAFLDPPRNYTVKEVEAPKGALVGYGMIKYAAHCVDHKEGARISSGRILQEKEVSKNDKKSSNSEA